MAYEHVSFRPRDPISSLVFALSLFLPWPCCLQAVGASGAAALRPALHKAAAKGVSSVKRVTLESAEQSKKTLCLALLREVSKETLAMCKETLAVSKETPTVS